MTAPQPPHAPVIRKELLKALHPFVTVSTAMGLKLFVREYALLMLGMGLAIFTENIALRLLGSLLAGIKLGSLYTLSHDGSHYTLVRPRWLNRALATLGFMHCFLNFRLWQYDHVICHHPRTNGPQVDIHRPMSLQEYRAAPAWRRAWERFARSPNMLARAPYFIVGSRWLTEKVFPNRAVHPPRVRREAWPIAVLMMAYLAGLSAWLAARDGGATAGFWADMIFALFLPLFIFHTSACVVTGLQHLHPQVPWFAPDDARFSAVGQETVTPNWRVPHWLGKLMHFSLDHAAHHMMPAIPSRRLREAQDCLNAALAEAGHPHVVAPLNLKTVRDVYVRCKLYDYENHQWLDFEGRPTSQALLPERA